MSYHFVISSQRELAILEYLWAGGESTASDIYKVFGATWQVSHKVVWGTMQIMLEKGFLEQYHKQSLVMYRPALSQLELEQRMLCQLAESVFHGSLLALWRSLVKHPQFLATLEKDKTNTTLERLHQPN
jgi:predicted transcriptional regulator